MVHIVRHIRQRDAVAFLISETLHHRVIYHSFVLALFGYGIEEFALAVETDDSHIQRITVAVGTQRFDIRSLAALGRFFLGVLVKVHILILRIPDIIVLHRLTHHRTVYAQHDHQQ